MLKMKYDYLKLCLVSHIGSRSLNQYHKLILEAVHGGITSLQLREKNMPIEKLKSFALSIKWLLKPFSIPFILNDHVDLAKEIDADGVHLGQSDLLPYDARAILGPNKIIGFSIESLHELEMANQLPCINYVAASAIFESKTKRDCKMLWGLCGLKKLVQRSLHPVIAIGGIHLGNVEDVMEQGASGVAIVSAIHDHPQPAYITETLIKKINAKREKYV